MWKEIPIESMCSWWIYVKGLWIINVCNCMINEHNQIMNIAKDKLNAQRIVTAYDKVNLVFIDDQIIASPLQFCVTIFSLINFLLHASRALIDRVNIFVLPVRQTWNVSKSESGNNLLRFSFDLLSCLIGNWKEKYLVQTICLNVERWHDAAKSLIVNLTL